MASHLSGPLVTDAGNFICIPMMRRGGSLSAASGTTLAEYRAVLPNSPLVLDQITFAFAPGASAPQGGNFRVKIWSGSTAKGVAGTGVGGGTHPTLTFSAGNPTFPARAVVRLTAHTVGATVAGGGGLPVLYFRHWD